MTQPAGTVPGPAVGTSATNEQLAVGAPGKPGPQGTPGVSGSGGITALTGGVSASGVGVVAATVVACALAALLQDGATDGQVVAWNGTEWAAADAGGSSSSYSQDCTAGGTIAYSGPTPVPPKVVLTGTPGSAFTYTWPSANFAVFVDNQTGQYVNMGGGLISVAGPQLVVVLSGVAYGPWTAGNGQGDLGTILAALNYGAFPSVVSVGAVNTLEPNAIQALPIYTVLQQYDALSYVSELPSGASGPQSPAAGQTWYQSPASATTPALGGGLFEFTESGANECICPQTYYPGSAWTTQAQTRAVARTADRITGTSQQVVHYLPLVTGLVGLYTIEVVVKAAVVGSGVCVIGDFASAILSISASDTATGAPVVLVNPATSSSTNFSDVLITASVVGSDLAISVTSSATAGVTDDSDFQTRTTAEIC